MPAVNYETFQSGIANSADILLITIENPKQLEEIFPFLEKAYGERIIILNKIDLLSEKDKRKISSFLQSKKYNFCLISAKTKGATAIESPRTKHKTVKVFRIKLFLLISLCISSPPLIFIQLPSYYTQTDLQ
jgi:ribosome biogenesis GTPase A